MRLFFALMLFSFSGFASTWADLEVSTSYKLTQNIQLKQIERSGAFLDLMSGERYVLHDILGLDIIRVTLFQFRHPNCPGPQLKTEMEIVPVKNTSPVVEVGAQVENCLLEIFVENKDLMTESFFK